MKRVLALAPSYPPREGGSATYFSTLVDSLADEHEFALVTPRVSGAPSVERTGNAVVYRTILRDDSLPGFVRFPLEFVSALVVALWVALTQDVDVIHAHSTSYATPAMTVVAVLTGKPILYDCQDEGFPRSLVKVGRTPRWLSCGPNVDDILIDNGVPPERIVRVPVVNPEYTAEFAHEDPRAVTTGRDEFEVLFVGAIRKEKGVFVALQAFERFRRRHPDATFTVVGDGPAKRDLMDEVADAGLRDAVRFTGKLDHRETLSRMAAASALVLPSVSEGLPRVVTEAFEIGLPVVVTPVGSVPEIVRHEETGLLVDRTPESVASALSRLHQDPSFAGTIAANAQDVSERWTWEEVRDRVSRTYEIAHRGERDVPERTTDVEAVEARRERGR